MRGMVHISSFLEIIDGKAFNPAVNICKFVEVFSRQMETRQWDTGGSRNEINEGRKVQEVENNYVKGQD